MPHMTKYHQIVLKNYDQLTKNQKKIAQFLLDNPDEIAFSSIEIISEKLNVGKATIVRLAQTLGYKGYLELRTELLNHLRSNLSPTKKLKKFIDDTHLKSDFLSNIAKNEIENIQHTLKSLNQENFDKAVDILFSASHIYTMGLGISSYLSQLAAYFLNRITNRSQAFNHGSLNFKEQIISLPTDAALIAISLPPYSIETIEAAEFAQSEKIRVVAITDKLISPIVKYADVIFTVNTHNIVFINTVSAVLFLIYALSAGIGLTDREASLKVFESFEKAQSKTGHDVRLELFKT